MTKRRKTWQYMVLAVIAASAVFVTGALARKREARRPEREEGRSHHLHEPEPLLRGLGELRQERAPEAGRVGRGAHLGVRSGH